MQLRELVLDNYIRDIILEDQCIVENSLTDLKKELGKKQNMAIFFAGSPRTGKSSFIQKIIVPRLKNVSIVDIDAISKQFTKDPTVYHTGSSKLGKERFSHLVRKKEKENIAVVYDVTGSSYASYKNVVLKAKQNGFKIIFIHVFSPLQTTIDRNKKADRSVEVDYLKKTWKTSQAKIKMFWKLFQPDMYIIVYNSDTTTAWYRYDGTKVKR